VISVATRGLLRIDVSIACLAALVLLAACGGKSPDADVAAQGVQQVYVARGPADAKVESCRNATEEDADSPVYGESWVCRVRAGACIRAFNFNVPRAHGIDASVYPRSGEWSITAPCSQKSGVTY
jgi:hypothetical protein